MKKRASFCLALILLLALIPTARAGTVSDRMIITAEAYLPDIIIDVVVPSTDSPFINPNKLPVEIGTEIVNSQIITEPCFIQNQSILPVRVNVEVTGSVGSSSSLSLVSESTEDYDGIMKRAFIYFEMKAVSDTDFSVPWDTEFDEDRHLVVRTTTRRMNSITTLGAYGEEKSYGAYRLTGDCTQEPREAWSERDRVTVKIVFTFSPLPLGTEIP